MTRTCTTGSHASSKTTAARKAAVTLTMVITVLLLDIVMTERWHWPTPAAVAIIVLFMAIDLAFFGANALKILQGGSRPLAPLLASDDGVHAVKRFRSRTLLAVSPFLLIVACQRDPGRDVKPMADPLRSAGPTTAVPDEIIPLDKVSKSQAAAVSQRIANTEITITYSRPVARGRELFGALVPYDQVWNPGADQATAIAITRDIQVNERPLPAGKYSLWVVPRPETWTVIFSKASDVYHTPYPGEGQDELRLDVRPEQGPHMEVLAFYFPNVEGKDAVLRLHWGSVMVPLSIRVP